MEKHTLILVGFLSSYTAYLDIPVEEAVRRYREENKGWLEETETETFRSVKVVQFYDEFHCYDAE